MFEYVLNKRRKYDGNTLVHLAVKFEQEHIIQYFLNQPLRWKFDTKNKNKDGHAIIHLAVRQRNDAIFNIIARHQS